MLLKCIKNPFSFIYGSKSTDISEITMNLSDFTLFLCLNIVKCIHYINSDETLYNL